MTIVIMPVIMYPSRGYTREPIRIFSQDITPNYTCCNCNAYKVVRCIVPNPNFGSKPIKQDNVRMHNTYKYFSDIEIKYLFDVDFNKVNPNDCTISYYICIQCNSLFTEHVTQNYKLFGITYQSENLVKEYK